MIWGSLINKLPQLRTATLKLNSLNAHWLGTSAKKKNQELQNLSCFSYAFLSYAKSHGSKLISYFFHLILAFWLHLWIIKLKKSTSSLNYLMAVLKGNFKRKTKAWVRVGKVISTLHPELQKWRVVQAILLYLATRVLRGMPYKIRGGSGEGRGYPLVASQNLSNFQARKKLWKMSWKQQLGAYENCVSGQVLKLNWSSKRKNRKVGNARRTAEVQVHTRIFLHL